MSKFLRSFLFKSSRKYYYYKNNYYGNIQRTSFQKILIFCKLDKNKFLNTDLIINFRNIQFNTNISDCLKILGIPRHKIIQNYQGIRYTTHHYNYNIGLFPASVTLYFVEGSFFCGQYTFKDILPIKDIFDSLSRKYLKSENEEPQQLFIKDIEENILIFSYDVVISICYVSGNKSQYSTIESLQNNYYSQLEMAKNNQLNALDTEL